MIFMNIELGHLKYFYMTVLHQGVGKAAEAMNVSQPVVSKMLSNLEYSLGRELFYKAGRKKALTDYGQLLYRKCQIIFKEMEYLQEFKETAPKMLSLGGTEPIVNFLMMDILKPLKEIYPSCHFNIYTSTQNHLMELVASRKLDTAYSFYVPEAHSDVAVETLESYRFHLVAKKSLSKEKETLERFIGSREIDDRSTHSFPALSYHQKKFPKARISFSSNSISLHKAMVLAGEGISILPEFAIKGELKRGSLIDLYPQKKFEWPLLRFSHKSSPIF